MGVQEDAKCPICLDLFFLRRFIDKDESHVLAGVCLFFRVVGAFMTHFTRIVLETLRIRTWE